MTREQFRQALKRNGLSVRDFAAIVQMSESQVYAWGGSQYGVPHFVRLLMRLLDERGGTRGLFYQNGGLKLNGNILYPTDADHCVGCGYLYPQGTNQFRQK